MPDVCRIPDLMNLPDIDNFSLNVFGRIIAPDVWYAKPSFQFCKHEVTVDQRSEEISAGQDVVQKRGERRRTQDYRN